MFVCLCKGLTESDVRLAGTTCPLEADALTQALGLDDRDCCGRCARNIDRLVALASCPSPCAASLSASTHSRIA
jgi:bacterioferritin-associated ferredoxin